MKADWMVVQMALHSAVPLAENWAERTVEKWVVQLAEQLVDWRAAW
jgi:hypothetical protein